jgi:NADH:ubiquinone oxidoreductase subunit 6 (subunit J)
MLGIAGFFILLGSPFVAMFQISVYVGAVAVLVIFIVMLVRTESLFSGDEDNRGRQIAGLIFSLLAMAGIGVLLFSSLFSNAEFKPSIENIVNKIGNGMLTYYSPVFILLGLTLAGSIIGALSLARREESDHPQSETYFLFST